MAKNSEGEGAQALTNPACFVIMPISDPDGYVKGHFKHVYDNIIVPACGIAEFKAVRADQVKQSNLIHLDILQKLLETPMALCDLSSRNPNVLFELALRQAFDKPVALVQEVGTPAVFDISPLRYAEYRKELKYHEVLEDQTAIATAIKDTFEAHKAGKGVNSIVKLLALSKSASLPEINAPDASADIQQLILAELSQLRDELRNTLREALVTRAFVQYQPTSGLPLLGEFLDEAESRIMLATEPADFEHAAAALQECRRYWMGCLQRMPNSQAHEEKRLLEMDKRIRRLENELKRALERANQKPKK